MGSCVSKFFIFTLALFALTGLPSCATDMQTKASVVAINTPESLEYGLDTYVLLPGDVSNANLPIEQFLRNYRALLDQLSHSSPLPHGSTPKALNRIHIPVRGFEASKPVNLKDLDHTTSRIYLDAISCMLPLYPELRERLISGYGPFLVTSSPGLNTHAARNWILIGSDSAQKIQDREMQFSMGWMLIVDLSQATPSDVRATVNVYTQHLDLRDYYDDHRKLSAITDGIKRVLPAPHEYVDLIAVQPVFLPGMKPGKSCSPYTDVLVDSGAKGYFRRAEFLIMNNYHREAIWDLNRSIALAPEFSAAYRSRGLCQLELGYLDHAISDFNLAIQLDPYDPELFRYRANAHFLRSSFREAIIDLDVYIAARPMRAISYCNRALAHAHLGSFEQALKDLEQCSRLSGKAEESYVEAIKKLRQSAGKR